MENSTEERGQSVLIEPENQLPEMTITDLPEEMRAAALRLGWTKLMPVQSRGIPYLMADRDMIIQSHTGSGKTGAFLIPLIMKIDPDLRAPQALVLVPTRELAVQVFKEFETLSEGLDINGVLVYGGVGYQSQLDGFRRGAQVVIGTPGRVLDHLGRRSLSLQRLATMVFDEADEMLSMGFYPAMRELRGYLPRDRRSWMFSATMPYKVQSLAKEFLRDPEFLSLSAGHVSVNTMEHRYYLVPAMEKDLMLMRLIEMENPESAIIFCNMKSEVEYLSAALQNRGYNADQISGDLDQKARERAMNRIRSRETRFLVATDVAARGIDISDLTHVFQHDVPKDVDSYIHRAGRTARAGNTGVVITLVSNMSEKTDLKKIARKYNVDFVQLEIPTEQEVAERISERVIVLLEEKLRHTDRTQRERARRLEPLVKSLAENDDERGLLTLLLDDIYHTTFHAATDAPSEPERAPEPAPKEARREERGGRREERGERRDEGRRDEGRRDEGRRDEGRRRDEGDDRREERAGVGEGADRSTGARPVEPGAEGEVPRKKKRKRNRGKRRGELERGRGGEGESGGENAETQGVRLGDDAGSRGVEESRSREVEESRRGEERRGGEDRRGGEEREKASANDARGGEEKVVERGGEQPPAEERKGGRGKKEPREEKRSDQGSKVTSQASEAVAGVETAPEGAPAEAGKPARKATKGRAKSTGDTDAADAGTAPASEAPAEAPAEAAVKKPRAPRKKKAETEAPAPEKEVKAEKKERKPRKKE